MRKITQINIQLIYLLFFFVLNVIILFDLFLVLAKVLQSVELGAFSSKRKRILLSQQLMNY